jgi:hypothetical protein
MKNRLIQIIDNTIINHKNQIINDLIKEEHIDLKGMRLKVVSPTFTWKLRNLFKRNRRIRNIFQQIQTRIKQRADPLYEKLGEFREVGGYSLIKESRGNLTLINAAEVIGEKGRVVVKPGAGTDIRWECSFPNIIDLPINWESVSYFIKYHSHPYINIPHPKDISTGIKDFLSLPDKNIRYLEAIYSKIWGSEFLWTEYYKE